MSTGRDVIVSQLCGGTYEQELARTFLVHVKHSLVCPTELATSNEELPSLLPKPTRGRRMWQDWEKKIIAECMSQEMRKIQISATCIGTRSTGRNDSLPMLMGSFGKQPHAAQAARGGFGRGRRCRGSRFSVVMEAAQEQLARGNADQ
ncbi:hypothetical protein BLNAU_19501 [Blattamonas nauphoetae]|uniref:Uncharacterized protein n=1 Tax=Blattamonas nauphoetae TaxID=2049346 RepID=A0ABQ9X5J5_9EUKA|nr:hypothetical protein BLNAU_19501 [Blattamonas nauphoetae]